MEAGEIPPLDGGTMGLARIWVHRRHVRHPEVETGWQYVSSNVAKAMIALGCAQPWQTEAKHCLPIDDGPPKGASEPEPEPKPDPEPDPEPAPITKPRRKYKRRDMQAEG